MLDGGWILDDGWMANSDCVVGIEGGRRGSGACLGVRACACLGGGRERMRG